MPWNGSTWIPYEVVGGNASSFVDLIQYANDISGDLFGIFLLMAIFMAIFIASSRKGMEVSLSSSLFITAILSFIMAAMDVIGNWVAWAMAFALMGSVMLLFIGGSKNV